MSSCNNLCGALEHYMQVVGAVSISSDIMMSEGMAMADQERTVNCDRETPRS
jgi:hypothetical protein